MALSMRAPNLISLLAKEGFSQNMPSEAQTPPFTCCTRCLDLA